MSTNTIEENERKYVLMNVQKNEELSSPMSSCTLGISEWQGISPTGDFF